MLELIIVFSLGFITGYIYRFARKIDTKTQQAKVSRPINQQQRLMQKAMHQSDSDRIRALNTLTANESAFYAY